MQLPNDNCSGQSETATSLHYFYIYRLKHLQQRKRHIIFQIVVGFSQMPLRHSHWREPKLKKYKSHNNLLIKTKLFFFLWRCFPTRVMAASFLMFLDHTQRRSTVGRTPLDEWSARRRDLYMTIHNTYNRQTSMPPVGFEPTISAG